jgi:hypothetical protein
MKRVWAAAAAACFLFTGSSARAAITITTGSTVTAPSFFNGLEGLPATEHHFGPYSEGGVTLDYVGVYDGIATTTEAYQGARSWYAFAGGHGYTRVTRTGGGDFSELSFAGGSGYLPGGPAGNLLYQILDHGLLVASGNAGPLPRFEAGWTLFHISGGSFDEVRLAAPLGGVFNNDIEGGIYDAFAAKAASGAPEPGAWLLMICGLGAAGALARRRLRQAAARGSSIWSLRPPSLESCSARAPR